MLFCSVITGVVSVGLDSYFYGKVSIMKLSIQSPNCHANNSKMLLINVILVTIVVVNVVGHSLDKVAPKHGLLGFDK